MSSQFILTIPATLRLRDGEPAVEWTSDGNNEMDPAQGQGWGAVKTGREYTLTPSLEPLAPYKDDCTVLTGLTSFTGGHGSCSCLLTGLNTIRNAKTLMSVDQQLADFHGSATRFPSLCLGTVRETGFGGPQPMTLSWSRNNSPVTPENRPEVLFEKLFGSEDNNTLTAAKQALANLGSLLDSIKDLAAALQNRVGKDSPDRKWWPKFRSQILNQVGSRRSAPGRTRWSTSPAVAGRSKYGKAVADRGQIPLNVRQQPHADATWQPPKMHSTSSCQDGQWSAWVAANWRS